jgi:hypothetical protein
MTQSLPLPLTAAMLAPANPNFDRPRYTGAGVAGDWQGGAPGNDINAATSNVSLKSAAATTAADQAPYAPRTQVAKGQAMVPSLVIAYDIGIDYGDYTGLEGRTGTITPRTPYPSVYP